MATEENERPDEDKPEGSLGHGARDHVRDGEDEEFLVLDDADDESQIEGPAARPDSLDFGDSDESDIFRDLDEAEREELSLDRGEPETPGSPGGELDLGAMSPDEPGSEDSFFHQGFGETSLFGSGGSSAETGQAGFDPAEPEQEGQSLNPFGMDDYVLVDDSSSFASFGRGAPGSELDESHDMGMIEEIRESLMDDSGLGPDRPSRSWQVAGDDFGSSPEDAVSREVARALGPEEFDDYDPIYGDRPDEAVLDDTPSLGEPEPDYRELEPMMADHAVPDRGSVIGGTPAGGRWARRMMVAAMAACILIIGVVTLVTVRPNLAPSQKIREWLGVSSEPPPAFPVPRVARPAIDAAVALPGVEITEQMRVALGLGAETPGEVSPESRRKFERLMRGLDWTLKGAGRLAIGLLPKKRAAVPGGRSPVRPVRTGDPIAAAPGAGGPGRTAKGGGRGIMTAFDQNLGRGTQAFAQLHNGHFFVGRIQKIVPHELVLVLDKGEITFVPSDLDKLLPLVEAEARILRSGPSGYVRLKNQNKIWGKILEDLPDVVTIETGASRIVLPRTSVDEVSRQPDREIELGKEEEDWSNALLPEVEPSLPRPEPEIEFEPPSGSIRVNLGPGNPQKETGETEPGVDLGPKPPQRAEDLKNKIRKRVPGVLPGKGR